MIGPTGPAASWHPVLVKYLSRVGHIKTLKLGLVQNIYAYNSLAFPILTYMMQVLPVRPEVIRAEANALQRLTMGPRFAIPTLVLKASLDLGFPVEPRHLQATNKAAMFRVALQSSAFARVKERLHFLEHEDVERLAVVRHRSWLAESICGSLIKNWDELMTICPSINEYTHDVQRKVKIAVWAKGQPVQFFLAADPESANAWYVSPTPVPVAEGPLLLQSHCWVDGALEEDFNPEKFDADSRSAWPLVRPAPHVKFALRGQPGKLKAQMGPRRVSVKYVRKPTSEQPLLSLVFVRWAGDDAVEGPDAREPNDGDWGQYGCPASDTYMSSVVKKGLMAHPLLCKEGVPDFEVFSLFVKDSAELARVGTVAPWLAASLRGKRTSSFWMMWPVEWEDTRGSDYAAYVDRHALFGAMRALESAQVRTGFPHPASQYELITSKSWMATLSLDPLSRMPAATTVSKGNVVTDAQRAAKQAISALAAIRQRNPFAGPGGIVGASKENKDGIKKGVAKLGWSWEARYVLIFHSEEDLAEKLEEILTHPGSTAGACIVQEWVDFDFEMRLYFLPPADWGGERLEPVRIECNAWHGSMENGQRRSFHKLTRDTILADYWEQDAKAYDSAKEQAIHTAQHLLAWLRLADAQPVPMIRLDFMLLRTGAGEACVTFGEFCEMGACCLGWEEGPPTIWRAALDRALE
ncbi:unnamed protein product [Prorocentrum cordatum]|uniref:Uncharacterized protein n=1 Tax=Prorocentrum cordatum TaxID=2364126 RepID=A0ABN9VFD2_9DINO|nr:unnamed protein product [Polarella glacialis]